MKYEIKIKLMHDRCPSTGSAGLCGFVARWGDLSGGSFSSTGLRDGEAEPCGFGQTLEESVTNLLERSKFRQWDVVTYRWEPTRRVGAPVLDDVGRIVFDIVDRRTSGGENVGQSLAEALEFVSQAGAS